MFRKLPYLLALLPVLLAGCGLFLGPLDVSLSPDAAAEGGGCPSSGIACTSTCDGGASCSQNGQAFLFGGTDGIVFDFGWLLDTTPKSGQLPYWRETAEAPPPRDYFAMSSVAGKAVLFGGFDSKNQPQGDTWMFDGTYWSQPTNAAGPPPRWGHAMAALDGRIVLFGGEGATHFSDTWTFDGTSWTQLQAAGPSARVNHAMATLPQGHVILFGGRDLVAGKDLDDTWIFDGTGWTQPSGVRSPGIRSSHAMASLGAKVVLFGGTAVTGGSDQDTWTAEFSPDMRGFGAITWTQASNSGPLGRYGHAMATAGDKIVLFGGMTDNGKGGAVYFDDTWTFDGNSWRQLDVAPNGPVTLAYVAMTTLP
jgi:hypothetical protein